MPLELQNYNDTPDNELLENFYADHDNKWLGILLPRYTLLLLGVCMKYLKNEQDAQDCVQHIFLKVINEKSFVVMNCNQEPEELKLK